MGSCLTLYEDERKARLRSEEIDRQLEELAKQERGIIKILLLGAGESGKSTLVKQMKIIHNDGFTSEELRSFRPTVLDNLLSSMKYVLNGMGLLRINLETAKNKIHAQTILSCQNPFGECYEMPNYVSNSLQALWNDKGVRLAVARGYEYELNDSAIYLFENMDRLCSEKYIPTTTDVLRARVRTNGIIETHFKFNGIIFRMYDVGGQRSERQKWINCFAGIRALLFVVALSSYDMVLQEDQTVNRLHDSLNLFSQICNNRFFVTTSMILFLNKLDLFREKILYSGRHLRYYLPDYKGPDFNVDHGALFVQHTFLAQNRNPRKTIYPHFLTATDTSNVEIVFRAVMDAILFENLERYALLL